jgi:hypothetical protein
MHANTQLKRVELFSFTQTPSIFTAHHSYASFVLNIDVQMKGMWCGEQT